MRRTRRQEHLHTSQSFVSCLATIKYRTLRTKSITLIAQETLLGGFKGEKGVGDESPIAVNQRTAGLVAGRLHVEARFTVQLVILISPFAVSSQLPSGILRLDGSVVVHRRYGDWLDIRLASVHRGTRETTGLHVDVLIDAPGNMAQVISPSL